MRRLAPALIAAAFIPLVAQADDAMSRRLLDQVDAATEMRPVMDPWSGRQTGVMLLSEPRSISPGFCRVDVLRPIFDKTVDWTRPLDGQARVVGFDARASYLPAKEVGCPARAPDLAAMFTAPMDAWVGMAWDLLSQVRDDARAGSLPVTCDDGPAKKCRVEIAGLDAGALRQVERCDARDDRSDYACFMFVVGGLILRVTFPVADGPIRSVEVERQPVI